MKGGPSQSSTMVVQESHTLFVQVRFLALVPSRHRIMALHHFGIAVPQSSILCVGSMEFNAHPLSLKTVRAPPLVIEASINKRTPRGMG